MASRNKKMGSVAASERLHISRRVVSTKRHTEGYMIGGRFVPTSEARRLAQQGRLVGVRVVGRHIQSKIGAKRRLFDLPVEIRR